MKDKGKTIFHETSDNPYVILNNVVIAYKVARNTLQYDTENILFDTEFCACSSFEKDGKTIGYISQENASGSCTVSVTILE